MHYNLAKLERIFKNLSYTSSVFTAFSDALDFFLMPYRYYPSGEELQKAHHEMTTHKNRDLYLEFFTELGELCGDGFSDPIGEFYMECISHGHLGQYFTPEPVCQMMVSITVGENPVAGQTCADPACGSGRMLLAAAKLNRHMIFYGADLDAICCKMSVLNMLLNSMTGEIAHLDTLRNQFYRGYQLSTKLINGYYHPYFTEFTEPEKSYIWLHPPKPQEKPANDESNIWDPHPINLTKPVQGSLF